MMHKKANSWAFDLFLVVLSMILIIYAASTGSKMAQASGFFIGEHQREVFSMISEGDKIYYYFDELSRQSLLYSLSKISDEPASGACGRYAGYSLINKGSASCVIDMKEKQEMIAEEYFSLKTKESGMSFQTWFKEEGDSLIFFGRAPEKQMLSEKGSYAIIPSFKTYSSYSISDLAKLASAFEKFLACPSESCLRKISEEESTSSLRFETGNCEDRMAFSNLAEDVIDCVASKDDDCFCSVADSMIQDYSTAFSNEQDSLKIKISSGDAEQAIITGLSVESPFKIDLDGKGEKYIYKSNGKISPAAAQDALQGKRCAIQKTKHRLCARTDKQFYFYDEKKKMMEKRNLAFKFAIDLSQAMQAEKSEAKDDADI